MLRESGIDISGDQNGTKAQRRSHQTGALLCCHLIPINRDGSEPLRLSRFLQHKLTQHREAPVIPMTGAFVLLVQQLFIGDLKGNCEPARHPTDLDDPADRAGRA